MKASDCLLICPECAGDKVYETVEFDWTRNELSEILASKHSKIKICPTCEGKGVINKGDLTTPFTGDFSIPSSLC